MFDWQLTIVCLMVAAALAFVVRQTWRTWTGKGGGCGGKCGCPRPAGKDEQAAHMQVISVEELTRRLRR